MEPDLILQAIREFGFPTVVALWFMWRVEKRLDKLIEQESRQLTAIAVLARSMDISADESQRIVGLLDKDDEKIKQGGNRP